MKICVLATSFPRWPGDLSGCFIFEPLKRLVARGIQVEVVVPHNAGLRPYEVLDGVRVHRFRYMPFAQWERVAYNPGGLSYSLRFSRVAQAQLPLFLTAFALKTIMVAQRCDLIHAHWVLSGLIALGSRTVTRRPYVLTLHGSDVLVGLKVGGPVKWISKVIAHQAAASLCVSQALQRVVRNELQMEEITVLRNGVDVGVYRPMNRHEQRARLGLPKEASVILSVGNLVPLKGYGYLVDALPQIIASHPETIIVLIGDGEERLRLRERAGEFGLSGRLWFPGYLPPAEIPAWINAADVFVLPSLSEGLGVVILEAMACGRPVVATRVGGIPEIVEDGRTGFLVAPQQPDQLAERINLLLDDPDLSHRMGLEGRQSLIEKGLTWDYHVDRLLAIYEDVLGRHGR